MSKSNKEGVKETKINKVIEELYHLDYTIIESMKFLVLEYKISLGEAKKLTSNHPIWNKEALAAKEMHEEMIEELKKPRRSFLEEPSVRIKIS